jgi:large subunit ribosomal protein L15
VNLGELNEKFAEGATVDEASLLSSGLIRQPYDGVKILGSGELKKKLAITVNKASESAKAAIEKAGGSLTLK